MRSYFSLKTLVSHLLEGSGALKRRDYQHTSVSFEKEPRLKMRDTSRPQRIEVLESSVGAMKTDLFHTLSRAQIEQVMGMMQQLLQAKLN